MKFEATGFEGLWAITPARYEDERGYFMETYREQEFLQRGIGPFIQDNESFSRKGIFERASLSKRATRPGQIGGV